MISFVQLLLAIILAFFAGKLISRVKLPSILGWLIAGMILGPHGISLMDAEILDAGWYQTIVHILECAVGLMIGTELVWKKLRRSGKAIVITTVTQSVGTFLFVSLVFGIVFYTQDIPLYLAFLFGGIALATAPAPALSIVREFKTKGPVTNTLIPMAALDDIIGCIIFFTAIAIVAGNLSAGELPAYMIALVVLLPLLIGAATGFLAGLVLNFMLIGMAFSATFSNMVSEKRLEQIMHIFNPILGIAMIIVILNLGAPLDYHLIMGAGLFTAIYIVARALGKYFGAYFGASITKSPKTVKKYLGFTLLPHSGVSLVFTGIAVSVLSGPAPECAAIIRGTIAAAAVINEIIAVVMAKKGFEWAGEFGNGSQLQETAGLTAERANPTVITISRQYGSGGREVGKQLSERLGIPFYDHELIEMAAETCPIDRSYFENADSKGAGGFWQQLGEGVQHDLSLSDKAFLHQTSVIREVAEKGDCIIVGRCANYILKDYKNVLKVFIYAELDSRKERIEHIYKEADEKALAKIEKTDKKRASYYEYYTGQVFGEAKNYDICLNSSSVGIERCVDFIQDAYQHSKKTTEEA